VLLADGEVRFILVGGVAVTLHGYVRLKSSSVREKDQLDDAALERLTEDPKAFE